MLLRAHSDLHMEFYHEEDYEIDNIIPPLPTDKDTILILAGDVGTTKRYYVSAFQKLSERFKKVIVIAGNHEHYKYVFQNTVPYLKELLIGFDNVVFLEKETIEIDNVLFAGATLWTDFERENKYSIDYAKYAMADFNLIQYTPDGAKFSPELSIQDHKEALRHIEETLVSASIQDKQCVVITHHAPSFKSVHPRFKSSALNGAFGSDLDDLIIKHKPILWVHGHMHDLTNYKIEETTILANPHGYPGELRCINHREKLIIELGDNKIDLYDKEE